MREKIWDAFLVALGFAVSAIGLQNPEVGPVWVVVAAALFIALLIHVARRPLGRAVARAGARLEGTPVVQGLVPAPSSNGQATDGVARRHAVDEPAASQDARIDDAPGIRSTRDAITEAMGKALKDRTEGSSAARGEAQALVLQAAGHAGDVRDAEARALVHEWRRQFDAIPKGHREGGMDELGRWTSIGYPEPAWSRLNAASDAAVERLSALLRDLHP